MIEFLGCVLEVLRGVDLFLFLGWCFVYWLEKYFGVELVGESDGWYI